MAILAIIIIKYEYISSCLVSTDHILNVTKKKLNEYYKNWVDRQKSRNYVSLRKKSVILTQFSYTTEKVLL